MKRTLALVLACALSLSLLAACGGPGRNGSSGGSASSQPAPGSSASSSIQPDGSLPGSSTPDQSGSSSASTVSPPAQDSFTFTLNRTDFTLKSAGASFRLKYTCEPDIDAIPEFSSSDEAVATVSEDGTVTAVSPGSAVISVQYGGLTAQCIVRCRWDTEPSSGASSGSSSASSSSSSSAATIDLADFYTTVSSRYEFPSFMELADQEIQDSFYPGLSDVATEQCLVYANMMSMNMGEFVLVQVKDSKDVDTVKAILQGRIDNMVNGGAWYPEPTEIWTNDSTVVSNGCYIMMVVHEDYSSIVEAFNALF